MRTAPGWPMRRNSLTRQALPSDIANRALWLLKVLPWALFAASYTPSRWRSTIPWQETRVMWASLTDMIWLVEWVG